MLAGDIIPFTEIEKENDFFNFLSDSFEQVYGVRLNHILKSMQPIFRNQLTLLFFEGNTIVRIKAIIKVWY